MRLFSSGARDKKARAILIRIYEEWIFCDCAYKPIIIIFFFKPEQLRYIFRRDTVVLISLPLLVVTVFLKLFSRNPSYFLAKRDSK